VESSLYQPNPFLLNPTLLKAATAFRPFVLPLRGVAVTAALAASW